MGLFIFIDSHMCRMDFSSPHPAQYANKFGCAVLTFSIRNRQGLLEFIACGG